MDCIFWCWFGYLQSQVFFCKLCKQKYIYKTWMLELATLKKPQKRERLMCGNPSFQNAFDLWIGFAISELLWILFWLFLSGVTHKNVTKNMGSTMWKFEILLEINLHYFWSSEFDLQCICLVFQRLFKIWVANKFSKFHIVDKEQQFFFGTIMPFFP